jgi:toxin ParE1/3/4
MPEAIWSPEALRDAEEIAFYIGVQDGRPMTAENIIRGLHELCNLIATQPAMGEARPEFGAACRVFPFKKRWIILYRPTDKSIQVLRVVDGTRDFDQLFTIE